MSARLRSFLLPVAASALSFAVPGSAGAGTASISGSVPNGGCDAARPVAVSGPSRIEVTVAATTTTNTVAGEIIAPDGRVVATGSYDTPAGGTYSIRVCSEQYASMDQTMIRYNGLFGTGTAGQAALPRPQAGTAATGPLRGSKISGKGAVRTRAGLTWFTVRMITKSSANVTVFNPLRQSRTLLKGMKASFGENSLTLTKNGVKLIVVDDGPNDRISYRSSRLKASGTVVRGDFQIVGR